MTTLKIHEVVSVQQVPGQPMPFDLKFSSKLNSAVVRGPGIYIITFEDKPVYLGKFQPFNRNNILQDRWLRHMETMTMRGVRVGFGKNACLEKLKAFLHTEIYTALERLPKEELNKKLRDTGVCTSIQRCKFTSSNWCYLKQAQPEEILNKYGFHFYKLEGLANAQEAKSVTSELENQLIKTYDFPINGTRGQHPAADFDELVSSMANFLKQLAPTISVQLALRLTE